MSVNKAILIGNLGKDPELKYTPGGHAVANFSLATTDRWTGQDGQKNERTVWHNIVAWGKQAELVKEYLHKGRQVYIEGRIDNRSYDKKDGSGKGYISEVVVTKIQCLGSKSDVGSSSASADAPSAPPPEGSAGGDDDLPF
ncbi:MAG: single-stranded DNA-binding protein [candidate division Zixibacteria bacterium]|nr:single-stranded DNA-binding protein [candidate division Zixibacteria bacterium]